MASGLGLAVLSQHALLLEPMHQHLAILQADGLPILRKWYVAYPTGKQLSVVAQAFLTHLRVEAPAIRRELSLPRRLRRARLTAAHAPRWPCDCRRVSPSGREVPCDAREPFAPKLVENGEPDVVPMAAWCGHAHVVRTR